MTDTRTLLIVAAAVIAIVAGYMIYENNQSGVEIKAPGVDINTK